MRLFWDIGGGDKWWQGKTKAAILRLRIAAVGGEGGFSPTITKKKKENTDGVLFLFCEEAHKRCVSVGKNAKQVPKVGKLVLNSYVKSREVKPKALSFF